MTPNVTESRLREETSVASWQFVRTTRDLEDVCSFHMVRLKKPIIFTLCLVSDVIKKSLSSKDANVGLVPRSLFFFYSRSVLSDSLVYVNEFFYVIFYMP